MKQNNSGCAKFSHSEKMVLLGLQLLYQRILRLKQMGYLISNIQYINRFLPLCSNSNRGKKLEKNLKNKPLFTGCFIETKPILGLQR